MPERFEVGPIACAPSSVPQLPAAKPPAGEVRSVVLCAECAKMRLALQAYLRDLRRAQLAEAAATARLSAALSTEAKAGPTDTLSRPLPSIASNFGADAS